MNKYKAWCIRQGSNANCSPGLILLGVAAVLALVLYHYRHIILLTLEYIGIGVGVALGLTGLTIIGLRVREHRLTRTPVTYEAPESLEPADAVPADTAEISSAADLLAEDGTTLAWTPDGKRLETWLEAKEDSTP